MERDYKVKNYDYTIVNSDFLKPIFARAFNLLESQVMVTGIPNNDKIFDSIFVEETKQRLLAKYPILKNKKIITYAPTFRGRISTHFREAMIDLEKVHQKLGEDYLIIYKSHPLISDSKYENSKRVLFIQDELISSLFSKINIHSDKVEGQSGVTTISQANLDLAKIQFQESLK